MQSVRLFQLLSVLSLMLVQAAANLALGHARFLPTREGFSPFLRDHGLASNPFQPMLESSLPFRFAHAILVKSQPEKESAISDVPEEILLTFDAGVGQEFLALAVIDEAGKRVDNHDAHLDFTDHSHLRASVSKLSPGRYTVRYRVLSADGHVVSGKYFFHVKAK